MRTDHCEQDALGLGGDGRLRPVKGGGIWRSRSTRDRAETAADRTPVPRLSGTSPSPDAVSAGRLALRCVPLLGPAQPREHRTDDHTSEKAVSYTHLTLP